MANPVVSIGTPGTSQYRVDWQPQYQGLADFGRGIGEFADKIVDRRQNATLAELIGGKADHDKVMSWAAKHGKLPEAIQLLTAQRALAPPETFTDVQSPYGRGGSGQRSSTSNRIVGYQAPPVPKDTRTQAQKDYEYDSAQITKAGGKPPAFNAWDLARRRAMVPPPGEKEGDRITALERMAADAAAKGETGRAQAFRRKAYGDPTEGESKAYGFANRMDASERILSRIDGVGADPVETVRSFFGNMASTPMRRQYEQAQRDFINAVLRRESGAVINDDEFANARAQYFPQVGDDPQTMAQKRANRNTARMAIRRAAGRANLIFGYKAPGQPAAPRTPAPAPLPPRPGMSPGGRGPGDEFGSPFDASGLAAPSPFAGMNRAGLLAVDPNTLQGAALDAYEAALDAQINGMRR